MNTLNKLAEYFAKFPGIGPRQSKRFVYFLLTQPKSFHKELATLLSELHDEVTQCSLCQRYFSSNGVRTTICSICSNENRDNSLLMIVEKDVDLENIERGKIYNGEYFVLGGTIPILDKSPEKKVRTKELLIRIKKNNFKEIILALSANPDGDNTATYLYDLLDKQEQKKKFKISTLGRGLSTGSELEYSDTETIKNAFENRH